MVASDLGALRGPLSGRHQLPLHLDASARAVYDFADPDDREHAYHLVPVEASCPADLEQWLDGAELQRLWPEFYLPRVVRAAWQAQQPALARIGAGPRVPGPGSPSCRRCVPMPMDPFQARVAQVALQAAAGRTFALAGSNALIAHGLLTRRDLRRGARHSHLDRTGAAVPEQCAMARGVAALLDGGSAAPLNPG